MLWRRTESTVNVLSEAENEKSAKKLLLLINPVTAKAAMAPALLDVIDQFEKAGFAVTVHVTQYKGDTVDTVRALGEEYDTVVCAGGDGTLNETVSAVVEKEKRPKIGYLPTGTTNDFAVSWGIPRKPREAAGLIAAGEPKPTDVNLFCGRPYMYVAAFGAFTEASYSTPQNLKKSLGWAAYIFEGIRSVPNIRPIHMELECDEGTLEGDYLYGMVSNTRRVGGFELKMKDGISISDGLMEVILVRKPANAADNPKMLGAVLMQDTKSEYITFLHTARLWFRSEKPLYWTLDGEREGPVAEGEISVLKHAIELYV